MEFISSKQRSLKYTLGLQADQVASGSEQAWEDAWETFYFKTNFSPKVFLLCLSVWGRLFGFFLVIILNAKSSTHIKKGYCFRSSSHSWSNRKSHFISKVNEVPLLIISKAEVWLYRNLGSHILINSRLLKIYLNQLLVCSEKKEIIAFSQQWFELVILHLNAALWYHVLEWNLNHKF